MRLDSEFSTRILVFLGAILLVVFLFPLPGQVLSSLNMPNTVDVSPNGTYANALKDVWISNLVLAVIGIVIAALTWKRVRYWEYCVLIFAATYLFLELKNYLSGGSNAVSSLLYFQSDVDVFNAIQMKIRHSEMALRNGMSTLDTLKVLSRELLLPILELGIFILLVFRVMARWKNIENKEKA